MSEHTQWVTPENTTYEKNHNLCAPKEPFLMFFGSSSLLTALLCRHGRETHQTIFWEIKFQLTSNDFPRKTQKRLVPKNPQGQEDKIVDKALYGTSLHSRTLTILLATITTTTTTTTFYCSHPSNEYSSNHSQCSHHPPT